MSTEGFLEDQEETESYFRQAMGQGLFGNTQRDRTRAFVTEKKGSGYNNEKGGGSVQPISSGFSLNFNKRVKEDFKKQVKSYNSLQAKGLKEALDENTYSSLGWGVTKKSSVQKSKKSKSLEVTAVEIKTITFLGLLPNELLAIFIGFCTTFVLAYVTIVVLKEESVPKADGVIKLGKTIFDSVNENENIFYNLNFTEENYSFSPFDIFVVLVRSSETFSLNMSENLDYENEEFNPTLTIWKRPYSVLTENDDIMFSYDQNSTCIFSFKEKPKNIVVEVSPLLGIGKGNFKLEFFRVSQTLFSNSEIISTLEYKEIKYFLINLEKGSYSFYSYSIDFEDFIDPILRIFDSDGREISEVFQSSPFDFGVKMFFNCKSSGQYVLELRNISPITLDLAVFFKQVEVSSLSPSSEISGDIYEADSNVYKLDLSKEYSYTFELSHFLYEEVFSNDLRVVIYQTFWPGLAYRLSTDSNLRVLTGTTEIDAYIKSWFPCNVIGFEPVHNCSEIEFIAENNFSFTFQPTSSESFFLDLFSINPIFINRNFSRTVGNFTLKVTREEKSLDNIEEVVLLDYNAGFEQCGFDSDQLTIQEDCEPGTWLFCRYEFMTLSFDLVSPNQVENFCECVSFMCSTIRGNKVSETYELGLRFGHITLLVLSVFAFLGLIKISLNILFSGKLLSTRCSTLLFAICFFLFSIGFFYTEIKFDKATYKIKELSSIFVDSIEENEAEESVLSISYYNLNPFDYFFDFAQVESILNQSNSTDYEIYDEEQVKNIIKNAKFSDFRKLFLFNHLFNNLYQGFAILSFLSISLIWIEVELRVRSLNIKKRKTIIKNLSNSLRIVQFLVSSYGFFFAIRLIKTNLKSYNNSMYIIMVFVSFFIILFNLKARKSVDLSLEKVQKISTENFIYLENLKKRVRTTSTIIILCNLGLFFVYFYSAVQQTSYEELLTAKNNPVSIITSIFQQLYIFIGMSCIFWYSYSTYTMQEIKDKQKRNEDEESTVIQPQTNLPTMKLSHDEDFFRIHATNFIDPTNSFYRDQSNSRKYLKTVSGFSGFSDSSQSQNEHYV
eukprot:snap_masked-scaffold_2-processed-gene-27.34-mRNA-1 protein AED:1.00 eAED:1.00 QI:0/0/0/0/1/1/5/0/1062